MMNRILQLLSLLTLFLGIVNAFLTNNVLPNRTLKRCALHESLLTSNEETNFSPVELVGGRRPFLASASIATLAASIMTPATPSYAADASFMVYKDKQCNFELKVPSSWEQSDQTLQDRRRIVLFVDPNSGDDDKNLIFIAYTTVRDDFTSLSSFGTAEKVGQGTILPPATLAGQDTESEMLKAESASDAYYFDYTVKSSGQPKRHFRSLFTLIKGGTGGAGSVLVTITAQTLESRYDSFKNTFDEIIKSYKKG